MALWGAKGGSLLKHMVDTNFELKSLSLIQKTHFQNIYTCTYMYIMLLFQNLYSRIKSDLTSKRELCSGVTAH